ncbi:MAG: hypothetical protein IJ282_00260 [Lachnospiraceae bacterium]|nr:hypothetical protein [Lachnospiraceae bacterium]
MWERFYSYSIDKSTTFNHSSQENLEALSKAIYEKSYPGVESAPVYTSFDAAFAEITRMAKEERIVFVIDEYPYLAKGKISLLYFFKRWVYKRIARVGR